jgi:hypothetical protein
VAEKRRPATSHDFVYRTTYLHEADLVVHELERLGIAFYRAQEGPLGVQWAMPAWPAWEPGSCFLVIVPGPHARRAKRLVRSLPVSQDPFPGVWQPGMTDTQKRVWRFWAWAVLAITAAFALAEIIDALRD